MFKNLQETIKSLNADVKNVANCEKAKKLRKKLLLIGLPLAIVGLLGIFVCFALFVTAGSDAFDTDAFDTNGFTPTVLVPFILAPLFVVIAAIGANIAELGFKIVVTGYTTNVINETVGNNCPHCGETINSEMLFCSKCGKPVKKECSHCKHINNHKSEYCEKCGTKL